MTEVAFDLVKVYPPVEPPHQAEGEVNSYCLYFNFWALNLLSVSILEANMANVFCSCKVYNLTPVLLRTRQRGLGGGG